MASVENLPGVTKLKSDSMKMRKGLSLGELSGMVLAFVVVAIIVSIGGTILSSVQTGQTANSYAYNVTTNGLTGINTFGTWLPTIAVIIAAAVIIGIIVSYFRQ